MKKIIAICCFIGLFLSVSHIHQNIGGVNVSFAQNILERQIFEVIAENNLSSVVTKMIVYADDSQKAFEHVSLNGWKVLEIKQITEQELKTYNISTGTVETPRDYSKVETSSLIVKEIEPVLRDVIVVPSNTSITPLGYPEGLSGSATYPNAEELARKAALKEAQEEVARQKVVDDKRKAVELAAKKATELKELEKSYIKRDNISNVAILDLVPTSSEIELLYTTHFGLGEVVPIDLDNSTLNKLPKEVAYVVFGHTDDVNVNINGIYKSNYELSFKRGEAIKKVMIENGFFADTINIVGFGTSYPKEANRTEGNLANRRVEIYGFRTQE